MKQSSRLIGIVTMVVLSTACSFGKVVDYRFEECSAKPESIVNHAQDALHGTILGDANITKLESSLTLSGNGSVEVEHDKKLDIVSDLTVSLWVNPSVKARQTLIARGKDGNGDKSGSNGEYFIILWEDGTIKYKHNQTADTYSNTKIPLNKWTHIVIRRKAKDKEIRIYINGQLDKINSYTIAPSSSGSKKLLIGRCETCSTTMRSLQGKLDQIKLYNIVLTDQEIKSLYESEKDGKHAENTCYVSPKPTVVNDTLEVYAEGSVTVDVLANDEDSNSSDTCIIDVSTLQLQPLNGGELSQDAQTLTVLNQGIWSIVNSHVVFSPEDGFLGSPTPITYRVSDSCGTQSDVATISITRRVVTDDDVGDDSDSTPPLVHGDSTYSVGDRVWLDSNMNGLQDADEEGVEDVVVVLYDNGGNVVERVNTNASGMYQFDNITEGEYSLGFSGLPDSCLFTSQHAGGDGAIDSDVNGMGRSDQFSLESNRLDLDAGITCSTSGADSNGSIGAGADTNSSDKNTTIPPSDHKDDCECETYADSIPSMGQIGVAVMLWLTTLLGLFLIREEKSLVKK